MGPPKKRPPVKKTNQRTYEINCFEYRWNGTEGHYYLFNPFTGETILGANYENINRHDSMWAKPDKVPSKEAYTIQLYHENYKSRTWGVRPMPTNLKDNHNQSATICQSIYRGHLARKDLRHYYSERYYIKICPFSGYYYFVDNYKTTRDGSAVVTWHKPLLAIAGDIKEPIPFDPDDHMADGYKYSMRPFDKGPYLSQEHLGKGNVTRVPQQGFLIESDWRDNAISRNEEIDFINLPLGTVIPFFDGIKVSSLTITHYVQVRAAICNNDWDATLKLWDDQPDQILTRLYCLHSFTKTEIPLDNGSLTFTGGEVLKRIVSSLENTHSKCSVLETCM
jgi:hypothetical protein